MEKTITLVTVAFCFFVWNDRYGLTAETDMVLHERGRVESPADGGRFEIEYAVKHWDARKTAVIVCDMWERHWCDSAHARGTEMAPRMNEFVAEARRRGALIVHAPSGGMEYYEGHPARRRAKDAPAAGLPDFLRRGCGQIDSEKGAVWPIDQSDEGCDCTPQCENRIVQRRQTDAVKILDEDAISYSGVEIGNLFAQRGIENVIMVGVHANMCVVGRPFGLRNLVRLGKNTVLVRDLTDAMYNPRMPPKVSHVRGTELVVEHIEKYICPTITSCDLLGGAEFRFKEDRRPRVVLVSCENEYDSAKTLPLFAQWLRENRGCNCRVLLGEPGSGIDGLEELDAADALVLYVRRQALPKQQMAMIRRYLDAGKPLVALRTSSHAFDIKAEPPEGMETWPEFDAKVLGGNYHNHLRPGTLTEIAAADEAAESPILKNLRLAGWTSTASLYLVSPLASGAKALLIGKCGEAVEPIAWTHCYRSGRVFYTSLGDANDFQSPQFRELLANALFWAMEKM